MNGTIILLSADNQPPAGSPHHLPAITSIILNHPCGGTPMNQQDIETFLTLTKTGSLTKTAEILYVSQPTVSHRLKELEEELGISLLVRGKGLRRVELTQKGEEFITIAERWLSLMSETSMLRNKEDEVHLHIGCPNTLNAVTLLPFYRSISNDPELNIRLQISTHYSYNIYELLERHVIDMGFAFHLLHFKNIIVEPILRERMVIVQEKSQAIHRDTIFVDDLTREKEVCFIWDNNYQIWHDQMISKGKWSTVEVDIYPLLAAFIKEPGHWAIAPISIARHLQETQGVILSEIADPRKPPERVTYLVKHKDNSEKKEAELSLIQSRLQTWFGNMEL
ncbi:MAG: LysR family transcriptional regulator [Lachnospiraceae bacterium]|nr:LysR family transcriptional regulator [Lachnospiraceae bacterium]